MLTLFFGDVISTLSTICLIALLAFIAFTAVKQKEIEQWGRRILILAVFGLAVCCLVVSRDGYVDLLQGGTGVFALDSMQITLAYIGGAVNAFSSLSSIFVRNQRYRKVMFFVLSGSIIFKVVLIELSRMLMA